MGVPSLFRKISKNEYSCKVPTNIDALYIDFNCMIHHVCKSLIPSETQSIEEQAIVEIIRYMNIVIHKVNPKKLLYIATDGVVPKSKMTKQRERRFKNSKHGVFDSNVITPGTPFMKKLHDRVKTCCDWNTLSTLWHLSDS